MTVAPARRSSGALTDVLQRLVGPTRILPGKGLQLRLHLAASRPLPRLVYADSLMDIYQLPNPKPYFGAFGAACLIHARSRVRVVVDCTNAATLVRRELFFSGWTATVDNRPATIERYRGLV